MHRNFDDTCFLTFPWELPEIVLCERTTIKLRIYETLEKIVIFLIPFKRAATENKHAGVILYRNNHLTSSVKDCRYLTTLDWNF